MAAFDYSDGGFPASPAADDTLAMKGTTYKYNGSAWEVQTGGTTSFTYTATSGQTAFTGADTGSKTLAYTAASIHVFLNGVLLDAADYTATDGTTVTLGTGASTGDTLQVVAYGVLVSSGGGGGASAVNDLTDVTVASVQNNDLLMYNSVASEWQNTNLGVSVTPTLTGATSIVVGIPYVVTVSNHATYDDPAYVVEVYTGSTLVVASSAVTDNYDGTFTFTPPATAGTHEIRVRCQDFGDLQSEIATKTFSTASISSTFRYFKIGGFVNNTSNWVGFSDLRFYTGAGQTGTAYPANMTSDVLPTPYVVTTNNVYNATYAPWKAFDSSTSAWYWALGSTNPANDWIVIDMGAAITVQSLALRNSASPAYSPQGFTLYGSSTGAFSGEETAVVTVSGLSQTANYVTNIG